MTKSHYNKHYYKWQEKAGKYVAQQDVWMYQKYIHAKDVVLDFGCGGGYLLEKFNCKSKHGIDINLYARNTAVKKGIRVYENIEKIPRKVKFDVIISHHTLEHTTQPFEILKKLFKRLKAKGIIICVVPIDDWRNQKKYASGDINQHLFTWTPLLLGNLFVNAGFRVKEINIILRAWLPFSRFYYSYIPKDLYNFLSDIWSRIIRSRQIRIIAVRKTS